VVPFRVKDVGAVLVPFQVPLNPGSELRAEPAAMDALYALLVIVTVLPLCENVPFQPCAIFCPLANENCKLQPLMAVEPVFVMVKDAAKPPGHWLVMA
jgi:hypothetical protein